MLDLKSFSELTVENNTKIVLLVIDGLGGLPRESGGLTELETARTPNMDALAEKSLCGLINPVSYGITPGSGPSHLAIFGYDPILHQVGRGVLEALGVGFRLENTDVASRANFAMLGDDGKITDRRAGRIPSEESSALCELLKEIRVDGTEIFIVPGKSHRFVAVFRGEGLGGELHDSDPQKEGKAPYQVTAVNPGDSASRKSAGIINEFIKKASEKLKGKHPANFVLMRGFAKTPDIMKMKNAFKLNSGAIAVYPMYRGLAHLVGMDILKTGETIESEFDALRENFGKYDYFYVHLKDTDMAGEDGDFEKKVESIEFADKFIPRVLELNPDVIAVTGDHSTPSVLKGHSWHPVPFMIYSKYCLFDRVKAFGERECMNGGLGVIPSLEVMPLVLANAKRLSKYGA